MLQESSRSYKELDTVARFVAQFADNGSDWNLQTCEVYTGGQDYHKSLLKEVRVLQKTVADEQAARNIVEE